MSETIKFGEKSETTFYVDGRTMDRNGNLYDQNGTLTTGVTIKNTNCDGVPPNANIVMTNSSSNLRINLTSGSAKDVKLSEGMMNLLNTLSKK